MAEQYYPIQMPAEEVKATLHGAVRGDVAQNKSAEWKAQARANIGAGEEKTGFMILGFFDTLEELEEWLQLPPQPGDAYGIGATAPVDVYIWDGVHEEWHNNGPLDISDFLDDSVVSLIKTWSSAKILEELAQHTPDKGIYYGACDTAADVAAKAVTLSDASSFELKTGCIVAVKFVNNNTAASPTLNVNGSGAKPFVRFGTTAVGTDQWTNGYPANSVLLCVYDGERWIMHFQTNDQYTPASASPKMDGTAAVGTSDKYAREDHVHPQSISTYIVTQNFSLDNQSISGNGQAGVYIPVSKSGYTPLGILGIATDNASSSGANANYCVISRYWIDNNEAGVRYRNVGSSAAKIKTTVIVLFRKN